MEEEPLKFDEILSTPARKWAREMLEMADEKGLRIATAESCTGGLLSTMLTGVTGVSHCFESGFVVYSDEAKTRLLGIPADVVEQHGAVSKTTALAMADHALERSGADVALSITGFAGPGDDDDEEGLVHFGVASRGNETAHEEHHFGKLGREGVRTRALEVGLEMLSKSVAKS